MAPAIPTTDERLTSVIAEWQTQHPSAVVSIDNISGTGNQTYLLEHHDGLKVVVRLNGKSEHLGVDRNRERDILYLIKDQKLTPKVLLVSEGFIVFEYLAQTTEPSSQAVATHLSRLHQFDSADWFQDQPRWTPFDTIQDYMAQHPESQELLSPSLKTLSPTDWQTSHYGLCHVDLNPANIVNSAHGVKFIDWEYARFGPTVYDIAVLFQTYPTLNQTEFLKHYELPVDKVLLAKTQLAFDVIELLWLAITNPSDWPKDRLASRASDLIKERPL